MRLPFWLVKSECEDFFVRPLAGTNRTDANGTGTNGVGTRKKQWPKGFFLAVNPALQAYF
jgi:hypothetical protein